MTLNIDLILKDNEDNSKIDIYGRMFNGTLRTGDTFELTYDNSTTIKLMVERIKIKDKLYPVALANQNVEVRFSGINVDKIDTQCNLNIPTNEEKEKADTTIYSVFNDLNKCLNTSFKEENIKVEFLTDFNRENDWIVLAKVIKDDTEMAVFCDKKVIFHKSCFIFQTKEWIEIKYSDIKKTGCTIANPADHFYVETDEYKYIFKNGIVNKDEFGLLISKLSIAHEYVNEYTSDEEGMGTYTIYNEERQQENEPKKRRIKPVYYNKNLGISRDYDRRTLENKKTLKEYKENVLNGKKTTVDEYTGVLLHKDGEAAIRKYGPDKAKYHILEIDHGGKSLKGAHEVVKKSVCGNLITDEQLKKILNKNNNYFATNQHLNRSKGAKSNSEYVRRHSKEISVDTSERMKQIEKGANKTIKKDIRNAALGNLAENAAIAATTDVAYSLFDVIPEEWNAVKYGQKTKMEAFKDGAKKIGKSAGVAALTSTVIVVGEALGRKILNSLFEE